MADVGAGAQDLLGLGQVSAGGQQTGQRLGGVPVAGAGPDAEPVQVPALGQVPALDQQMVQPRAGENPRKRN